MIKIFSKSDPEPTDIILAYTETEALDRFEAVDKLAVIDRLIRMGKNYALDWGITVLVLTAFIISICWLINYALGFATDTDDIIFLCVLIPLLSGLNVIMGIRWALDSYRDALQVALNE